MEFCPQHPSRRLRGVCVRTSRLRVMHPLVRGGHAAYHPANAKASFPAFRSRVRRIPIRRGAGGRMHLHRRAHGGYVLLSGWLDGRREFRYGAAQCRCRLRLRSGKPDTCKSDGFACRVGRYKCIPSSHQRARAASCFCSGGAIFRFHTTHLSDHAQNSGLSRSLRARAHSRSPSPRVFRSLAVEYSCAVSQFQMRFAVSRRRAPIHSCCVSSRCPRIRGAVRRTHLCPTTCGRAAIRRCPNR